MGGESDTRAPEGCIFGICMVRLGALFPKKQDEVRIHAINIRNKQVSGTREPNKNHIAEEAVLKSAISGSPQCVWPLRERDFKL